MSSQPKTEMTVDTERRTFDTSELRKLSSDPAITKHPDPKFHFKFRDPDEVGDEETVELVANSSLPPRGADLGRPDWRMRRSPKE
jgi:hypothetical protein